MRRFPAIRYGGGRGAGVGRGRGVGVALPPGVGEAVAVAVAVAVGVAVSVGVGVGVGELIALASSQVPYLQSRGVLPADFKADKTAFLLDDALARSIPLIYFSCGTMPRWEADIYAHNLPPDQWNARWWKYVSDFQGIEPPSPRGEEFCDAATKTHINDNPAYYTTMRLRRYSSFNYTTTSLARFSISHHNHVTTLTTKRSAPG